MPRPLFFLTYLGWSVPATIGEPLHTLPVATTWARSKILLIATTEIFLVSVFLFKLVQYISPQNALELHSTHRGLCSQYWSASGTEKFRFCVILDIVFFLLPIAHLIVFHPYHQKTSSISRNRQGSRTVGLKEILLWIVHVLTAISWVVLSICIVHAWMGTDAALHGCAGYRTVESFLHPEDNISLQKIQWMYAAIIFLCFCACACPIITSFMYERKSLSTFGRDTSNRKRSLQWSPVHPLVFCGEEGWGELKGRTVARQTLLRELLILVWIRIPALCLSVASTKAIGGDCALKQLYAALEVWCVGGLALVLINIHMFQILCVGQS
eukprot:m.808236 g.808236  ORF g.808236 m.808236 type:complete len:326 (+) comp23381_c1_seq25:413-1390(+)